MDEVHTVLNGLATVPSGQVHGRADQDDGFVPITKRTMCYIVGAILFNESGDVLLVQEAKQRCRGKWYFPAGRLEPNESIIEGAQREVKEEAGVEFAPTKLLCVETMRAGWWRFTFTGTITGGKVKTEPDGESLQASWVPVKKIWRGTGQEFPLRACDFLPLIEMKQYETSSTLLPAAVPHNKMLLRLVWVGQHQCGDFSVLMNDGHLPQVLMDCNSTIRWPLNRIAEATFEDQDVYKVHGVLSVEHSATSHHKHDGMCLTLMLIFRPSSEYLQNLQYPDNQQDSAAMSDPELPDFADDLQVAGAASSHAPSSASFQVPPTSTCQAPPPSCLQPPTHKSYAWEPITDKSVRQLVLNKLQPGSIVPLLILF